MTFQYQEGHSVIVKSEIMPTNILVTQQVPDICDTSHKEFQIGILILTNKLDKIIIYNNQIFISKITNETI